jgi:hypothetical protein
VFTNLNGDPMAPDRLTRTFRRLTTEAGLPPVRLHDLRHGAATLALAAGVDLQIVQEMLDHSSIVLTADSAIFGPAASGTRRGGESRHADHPGRQPGAGARRHRRRQAKRAPRPAPAHTQGGQPLPPHRSRAHPARQIGRSRRRLARAR